MTYVYTITSQIFPSFCNYANLFFYTDKSYLGRCDSDSDSDSDGTMKKT